MGTKKNNEINAVKKREFKEAIKNFEKTVGLRKLPWRQTRDPYKIVVSELMLQQTQVDRVLPKYRAFLESFPTIEILAAAPTSSILTHWSGLGYNRRALYLKQLCQTIVDKYNGKFPKTIEDLESLPGIGPYTARAVFVFAYNKPVALIESNVRTIFLHHFFNDTAEKVSDTLLIPYIESVLEKDNPRKWYNLLMDYGTFLKKQGDKSHRKSAQYLKQSKFTGSLREARGGILKVLIHGPKTIPKIYSSLLLEKSKIDTALSQLLKEGFIVEKNESFSLAQT